MKTTLQKPAPRPANRMPAPPTKPGKNKAPIEFYLFMGILVLALLYFVAAPFLL